MTVIPEEKSMTEADKKKPKKPVTYRQLTVAQKAEAVALWRTGSVTLEELGKKYKKHPETLSRLFTRMGIEKGSGAAEAVRKVMATVEARTLSDTEETVSARPGNSCASTCGSSVAARRGR